MGLSARRRYQVLHRDGFVCRYCGQRPPAVQLHVDHIVPRAKGGSDDPENLITACADCNRGKRVALLHGIEEERAKGSENVDPLWDLTHAAIRLHELLSPWVWGQEAEQAIGGDRLEELRMRLIETEFSILDHGLVAADSPWRQRIEEYRREEERLRELVRKMEREGQ